MKSRRVLQVATFGHGGHGKTTLAAAISARQAHRFGGVARNYLDLINGVVRISSRWRPVASLEYQSAGRSYSHADHPSEEDLAVNLILGEPPPEAAILVVAADEGPRRGTGDVLRLLRRLERSSVVVFLNKVDLIDDPDMIDLAELVTREMLQACDFPGDEVPIIRGNAFAALQRQGMDDEVCRCIDELMEVLDTSVPLPEWEDGPFRMTIEDALSIKERGTAVIGRIGRGKVKAGDAIEIVGRSKGTIRITVQAVEYFNRPIDCGETGLVCSILLQGIESSELERGQVLAAPGSILPQTRFEAILYLLRTSEGGKPTPLVPGSRNQFYINMTSVMGLVKVQGAEEDCRPGRQVLVTVRLPEDTPQALGIGDRFLLCDAGRTLGLGIVVGRAF
jgi:elongation factor Tu